MARSHRVIAMRPSVGLAAPRPVLAICLGEVAASRLARILMAQSWLAGVTQAPPHTRSKHCVGPQAPAWLASAFCRAAALAKPRRQMLTARLLLAKRIRVKLFVGLRPPAWSA